MLFHDFTTAILVVWSGGGEKWQLWVENGKEIVEQMMPATFRQLLPAADKGQSGKAKSEAGTNNARPQRFRGWRQIAEITDEKCKQSAICLKLKSHIRSNVWF